MESDIVPEYGKELLIYEKETLQKIERFRSARKSWLSNNSKKIPTKVDENLDQPSVYKGGFRLHFLKKLKPSTRSRPLFKTPRPLRYYTLKPKTSGGEVKKKRRSQKQEKSQEKLVTPTHAEKPIEKKEKNKQKIVKVYKPKTSGPCQEALRKLREAHLQEDFIESCRCEDGREVTVVIKGLCLCDKNSLNNVKLNKVCEKYSKLGELPVLKSKEEEKTEEIEESLELKKFDMKDSSEMSKKNLDLLSKTQGTTTKMSESKLVKKVDFNAQDIERKMQPKKLTKMNDSEITVYKKLPELETLSNDSASEYLKESNKLSEPQKVLSNLSLKSVNMEEENSEVVKKAYGTDNLMKGSTMTSDIEENLVKSSENFLGFKGHTTRVSGDKKKIEDDEDMKKTSASTITLFKNNEGETSNLGLTKEQMEVLKKKN